MNDSEQAALRTRFPILERSTYLVSHSLGAMPGAVSESLDEYATAWATRGIRAWSDGWWDMPLAVGDDVARIIGAPARSVAMHQNVSVCQSLVLSCLTPTPQRNRVVLCGGEFPSVRYVYEAHAQRMGLEIVDVAPGEDGFIDMDALCSAIDDRTLLVPISHVMFATAQVIDVASVVARAHDVGAMVLLDTYQSAGIVPVTAQEWDVDFVCGGSVKWLCGGPGAGYLYVAPRLHDDLQPAVTGWMAHAEPFAFDPDLRYADGIARFLHGSPAVPALYAARCGYAFVNEVGVDAIRTNSLDMTAHLHACADARGWRVVSPREPERRGGSVVMDVPNGAAVVAALAERDVLVDYRPGAGVRMSAHIYNTRAELDRAVTEIDDILATNAFDQALAHAAY